MEYNENEKNQVVKRNFWKDKKNIAIVILSVLLFFSIGISDENSNSTYLKNQVSDLNNQLIELKNENDKLNLSLSETNEKNNELEKELNAVKEENQELISSKNKSLSTSTTTQTTATSASPSTATTNSGISNSYTVYVTKTGSKYHRDGCRYLSKSQIAKSKNDAISQRYTPCSVCNP